jgi:hypothetical protein
MPYRKDRVNRHSFGLSVLGVSFVSSLVSSLAAAQPAGGEPAGAEPTDAAPPEAAASSDKPAPTEPAREKNAANPAAEPPPPEAAGALGDVVVAKSKFTWEPFGYLRLQYVFVQNDPNVAFIGRDDGFELQNARIGVRGNYLERVRYAISIDGGIDERAEPNSPDGRLRTGLRDAYADVVVGGKTTFLRGGYFQTWADPNRLVADTVREFVDRPIESRGVRSTEGYYSPGLAPGRSLGAAKRIEPAQPNAIGFEVAVQNGADEFASNNDNDLPAISAALMFRIVDDGFIIAGGRWNARTVGDLPFRQDETDFQGSLGAQLNTGAVRIGAGAILQHTTFGSTAGPAENAYGAHAQLAVALGAASPVLVGYRFGILDPSSLIVTDRVMEHTVGAAIAVPSYRMRVQLQATHVMEQSARELSNTRVQVAGEVSL